MLEAKKLQYGINGAFYMKIPPICCNFRCIAIALVLNHILSDVIASKMTIFFTNTYSCLQKGLNGTVYTFCATVETASKITYGL